MSTRPQISPYLVIPNADASPANTGSMGASITGAPTIIQKLSMISYAVAWTGTTPVGTLSVQVSNDFALNANGSVKTAGTWNSIPLDVDVAGTITVATTIPVSGNSGNGFIDIDEQAGYAIRLVYTRTSGTGTLSATLNAKVS